MKLFLAFGWTISGGWLISELQEKHPTKSKKLKWIAAFFGGPAVWCVVAYVKIKEIFVKHKTTQQEINEFYDSLVRAQDQAMETIGQFLADIDEEQNGGR